MPINLVKMPPRQEEYDIQCRFVNYILWTYPTLLFTIAPQGMRMSRRMAGKIKNMGYRKGTSDMLIFEARGLFHGLFIELKAPAGTLSKDQGDFLLAADRRGYKAVCCKGYDIAVKTLDNYLQKGI